MAENIVDTSTGKSDGLDKCPKCGSTEISLRQSTGMLICHFCRHEWSEAVIHEKFGLDSDIGALSGTVVSSGAGAIESTDDVLTLKCQGCGAEVIVNTSEALQSRCHWCRQTLSVNSQLPNGAVPDGILPFSVTRDDAIARISQFVKKRSFFAHPTFVREFAPTEVVGVYMPYFLLDANTHVDLAGHGEVLIRSYTRKRGENNEERLYDADLYQVARSFDLHIDDVVLETSEQRADIDWRRNTNNVINAIQPFDVKQAVQYNANYLRGFTSEHRDLDVSGLSNEAYNRALSIGRARAEETIRPYDRGVRWESEHLTVKGTRWVSVYLPVWLYSYFDGRLTHFVAVNGRTGETMGSIPMRSGRLAAVSVGIAVVGTIVGGALAWMIA